MCICSLRKFLKQRARSSAVQRTAVMPLRIAGGGESPQAAVGGRRGQGVRTPQQTALLEPDSLWLRCPVSVDHSTLSQMHTNRNPAFPTPPSQTRRVCLLPYSLLCEEGGKADVLNPPAFLISLIATWKKGKEEECFSLWLSQSKIPAEQLKIYGQLVVRELAQRARHLSAVLPGHQAG